MRLIYGDQRISGPVNQQNRTRRNRTDRINRPDCRDVKSVHQFAGKPDSGKEKTWEARKTGPILVDHRVEVSISAVRRDSRYVRIVSGCQNAGRSS